MNARDLAATTYAVEMKYSKTEMYETIWHT